jgi:hypothetical protein
MRHFLKFLVKHPHCYHLRMRREKEKLNNFVKIGLKLRVEGEGEKRELIIKLLSFCGAIWQHEARANVIKLFTSVIYEFL